MATTAVVTQSTDGKTLTYTFTPDVTVTSAILNIYDSNGALLSTINMGTSLSANYNITSDVYLSFVLTLNGGTTVTTNYISIQFYEIAQAQLASVSNLPCGCSGVTCTSLVKGREAINAAQTYFAIGDSESSQLMLTSADYYILNPTY